MPWKSKAQQRWGNSQAGQEALGKNGVKEWNQATGDKRLPERLGMDKKQKSVAKLTRGMNGNQR